MLTFSLLGKIGQLGNQMFQYSVLLGVKYKLGYDIIITPETKKNSYLFDFFDLKECKIEDFEYNDVYNEKHFHYDEGVFDVKPNVDFRGYFQTEKYFNHCSDIVRNEFTFKKELSDSVDDYLSQFKGKKLVSLHVRRGDYLINPDYHPLPPISYYENGMNILDDGNTIFICVTNDIIWCEENLKRDNLVCTTNHLTYDMCLISKCDDHIIANSSFSWWGSWLCKNPNKKIISPKTWFGERASNLDTKDLYCDNFIKL